MPILFAACEHFDVLQASCIQVLLVSWLAAATVADVTGAAATDAVAATVAAVVVTVPSL